MKEPLTKSISIQELLHMREEQKMSNQQIASSLGVSVATIRKYIGASRKYTRRDPSEKKPSNRSRRITPPETYDTKSTKTYDEYVPVRTTHGMQVISDTRVVELKGMYCTYAVYVDAGKVQVSGDGFYFQLDTDQCKHMARDLGNIFGMVAENERQKLT